ncbi:cytochrome P450 [Obba rivulosa]|uniref:Cytochrome P450 n=1 Tax=Obba rivulosa TaxID=1052685 RepID=A0A8E2ARE4_9APHY|nr:cytochrome P450 [Obba rivulosa]
MYEVNFPQVAGALDVGLYIIIFITIVFFLEHRRCTIPPQGLSFPPGPYGKPIVGSILELAQEEAPRVISRYKNQYSDVVMFMGLGNKVLVLNILEAINELFDRRASNYFHRPASVVGGELMHLNEQSMIFMPYGPEWRAHRKLAHAALNPAQVKGYHTLQEDIAALFAKALVDTPHDFYSHVRVSAGRTIIAITYGMPVSEAQEKYIATGERFLEVATKAVIPGNYICDFLPFLKYALSWVHFQREAREGRALIMEFLTKPFDHVKRDLDTGVALPSLTRELLLSSTEDMVDLERRIVWVGGSLFGAGAETTYATVLSFILAMALNPEKQKLAQQEIDSIIGGDRLPMIQDCHRLPYVRAVVKETMRWQLAVPLGLPRLAAKDDTYGTFYIPKNTILIPNIWAIGHNKNGKYHPDAFISERFIDDTENVVDPMLWAFGFGRRICPGRHMGENSVFIHIATILCAFDVFPPLDGKLVQDFTQHLVRCPKPFKCVIVPRSAAKAKLVYERAQQ